MKKPAKLSVDLGDRSYSISIAAGLLRRASLFRSAIVGSQVLVVTNETIAPLYLSELCDNLADFQVDVVVLPDGEQYKELAAIETIYNTLLEKRHNRTTTLIALGGGVVGDMTGFAAATYQRGVAFLQVPTTLLAQVDSSVGGKTGVNHALGKNMIGAFHQPAAVVIDTDTLKTLPAREFRAGIAEVIKYGLIADFEFFVWLERNIEALMARDKEALTVAIARSCENKAKVVARDERESGVRAILNLGHTFGHALETATGYKVWLHGEAVACGMQVALDLSDRMGWIEDADVNRGRQLIAAAGLPQAPPRGLPSKDRILELMGLDKKVLDGKLRLVLLKGIGDALVTDDIPKSLLLETLSTYLDTSMLGTSA